MSSLTNSFYQIMWDVMSFFYSPWTKGVLCCCICVEAISLFFMANNGGGTSIFKKFLPLIAGTVIFMCAGVLSIAFGSLMGIDTKAIKKQYNKKFTIQNKSVGIEKLENNNLIAMSEQIIILL